MMKTVLQWLVIRPNRWFDNLQEPKRFWVFFGTFAVFYGVFQIAGGMPVTCLAMLALLAWRLAYFAFVKRKP